MTTPAGCRQPAVPAAPCERPAQIRRRRPFDFENQPITADACYPRHRHQEFLRFLKKVAAAHPGIDLHVVCDNYAAHKHPAVKAWLKDNPRVTLHFTPTGCSWLNMVGIFFGIITRQAIRRGTFRSVRELTAAIGAFIDACNQRCQLFAWTKDAGELLAKVRPSKN
jgi:transposase